MITDLETATISSEPSVNSSDNSSEIVSHKRKSKGDLGLSTIKDAIALGVVASFEALCTQIENGGADEADRIRKEVVKGRAKTPGIVTHSGTNGRPPSAHKSAAVLAEFNMDYITWRNSLAALTEEERKRQEKLVQARADVLRLSNSNQ